jgi:hypothetical protein
MTKEKEEKKNPLIQAAIASGIKNYKEPTPEQIAKTKRNRVNKLSKQPVIYTRVTQKDLGTWERAVKHIKEWANEMRETISKE